MKADLLSLIENLTEVQPGLSIFLPKLNVLYGSGLPIETKKSMAITRITKNLNDCGIYFKTACSNIDCGWQPDPEDEIKYAVRMACGIRICNHSHCVKIRSARIRDKIKPLFQEIRHLRLLVLTIPYQDYEFKTKKDIRDLTNKVRGLFQKLKRYYPLSKVIINLDCIKKPGDKWHIHYNSVFNCEKLIPVKVIQRLWKGRFKIQYKNSKKSRAACLSYLVRRIAQVNPPQKNGSHIPISVEEYHRLFYKSKFYRVWFWDRSILVSRGNNVGNIYTSKHQICPICGFKLQIIGRLDEESSIPPPLIAERMQEIDLNPYLKFGEGVFPTA
jgi:hypothetical protein